MMLEDLHNGTMDNDSSESEEADRPTNIVIFPCKLLRKFIHLYKEQRCLWDRTSFVYKQKQKRHEAITKLTKLVQEHEPSATRVHVLRKIESLRACVRREHKRVLDSRRIATNPDEIYKPHLWYYDLFSFMFEDNSYNAAKAEDKGSKTQQAGVAGSEEEEEGQPVYEEEPHEFEHSVDPSDYSLATSMVEVSDNSKRYSDVDDDGKTKRLCADVLDEYDAIGINVAAKLRNLPPNMRIVAEKLINDVLFQAQLNGLNSSTVIITADPFKQDPM